MEIAAVMKITSENIIIILKLSSIVILMSLICLVVCFIKQKSSSNKIVAKEIESDYKEQITLLRKTALEYEYYLKNPIEYSNYIRDNKHLFREKHLLDCGIKVEGEPILESIIISRLIKYTLYSFQNDKNEPRIKNGTGILKESNFKSDIYYYEETINCASRSRTIYLITDYPLGAEN